MKKIVAITFSFLLIYLSGCNNALDNIDDLDSRYYYEECIYLNPLSSSTKDYQTDLYSNFVYIEFDEKEIVFNDFNGSIKEYFDIKYQKMDIEDGFSNFTTLDIEDVFDEFNERYDIYSSGERINLILFVNDEGYYIAKTEQVSSNSISIWTIFKIGKIS